jgi:glycosyltransferase involved in cell wall biosynthesis
MSASRGEGRLARPLRILHLANALADTGNGIVHVMVDLAIGQRQAGHEVAVAAAYGQFAELLRTQSVRYISLPQHGMRNAALAIGRLAMLVRRNHFDILHAHTVSGALAARLAIVGTPARLITHLHNSWQRHAVLMRVGHRVIAVSDAVRQEMIGRGIPAERITTVANGPLGSVRAARVVPEGPIVLAHPNLVTVAGMYVRKGITDLLEAFRLLRARVPGVTLYLVGDGADRSRFEDEARKLGLGESAVFLRFRRDVDRLLRQADVFVLASRSDPNPLVIPEARAAGCAIVSTAVDGIPEALDGGRAGMLVPARDPGALSAAVAGVLCDPGLNARLRGAAGEGLERLRVERMCGDVLDVYWATVRPGVERPVPV